MSLFGHRGLYRSTDGLAATVTGEIIEIGAVLALMKLWHRDETVNGDRSIASVGQTRVACGLAVVVCTDDDCGVRAFFAQGLGDKCQVAAVERHRDGALGRLVERGAGRVALARHYHVVWHAHQVKVRPLVAAGEESLHAIGTDEQEAVEHIVGVEDGHHEPVANLPQAVRRDAFFNQIRMSPVCFASPFPERLRPLPRLGVSFRIGFGTLFSLPSSLGSKRDALGRCQLERGLQAPC